MKILSLAVAANIGFTLLFAAGNAAESAELKVLCANGMQTVMEDLGPRFENATGHKLAITFDTGGATIKRAQGNEATDVIIALRQGVDSLVKDGRARGDSAIVLARTGISVATRKGAAKPDISSPDALKRTLLAARSITYLNPADGGASGIHFAKVLDRLGIASEMKSKTIFAPKASDVGALVATGEAEMGVLQFQLLFLVPGIDIVGPLPGDLQATSEFSAAVMRGARDAETSKVLLSFLRTPEAAAVIKAKGMESDVR